MQVSPAAGSRRTRFQLRWFCGILQDCYAESAVGEGSLFGMECDVSASRSAGTADAPGSVFETLEVRCEVVFHTRGETSGSFLKPSPHPSDGRQHLLQPGSLHGRSIG